MLRAQRFRPAKERNKTPHRGPDSTPKGPQMSRVKNESPARISRKGIHWKGRPLRGARASPKKPIAGMRSTQEGRGLRNGRAIKKNWIVKNGGASPALLHRGTASQK